MLLDDAGVSQNGSIANAADQPRSPIQAVAHLCQSKELKVAVRAMAALGYWAAAVSPPTDVLPDDKPALMECVKTLLSLHTRKEDQIQFAVGEALCFAHGGEWPASLQLALCTSPDSAVPKQHGTALTGCISSRSRPRSWTGGRDLVWLMAVMARSVVQSCPSSTFRSLASEMM